ncbi:hypothetical protein BGZ68_006786 [Mortierella alpina]|nr:hypothetical protein BGZ68_006786 [Mortierella alpina]
MKFTSQNAFLLLLISLISISTIDGTPVPTSCGAYSKEPGNFGLPDGRSSTRSRQPSRSETNPVTGKPYPANILGIPKRINVDTGEPIVGDYVPSCSSSEPGPFGKPDPNALTPRTRTPGKTERNPFTNKPYPMDRNGNPIPIDVDTGLSIDSAPRRRPIPDEE